MKQYLLNYFAKRRRRKTMIDHPTPRVLVIPYSALGDMMMTMPTFAAIKHCLPGWKMDVLANPRTIELLEQHPDIDDIYEFNVNRRWAFLREPNWPTQSFDMVLYLGRRLTFFTQLNLQQLNTHRLYSLAFPDEAILQKKVNPATLFDALAPYQQDDRFPIRMRAITALLGESLPYQWHTKLYLGKPAQQFRLQPKTVIFNPAGTQRNNRLSQPNCHKIITALQKAKFNVAVFSCSINQTLLEDMSVQWLSSPSLSDAKAWLEQADAVLTTDTSIGHLGAAVSTPTAIIRAQESWRALCDPIWGNTFVCPASSTDINDIEQHTLQNTITWLQQKMAHKNKH